MRQITEGLHVRHPGLAGFHHTKSEFNIRRQVGAGESTIVFLSLYFHLGDGGYRIGGGG